MRNRHCKCPSTIASLGPNVFAFFTKAKSNQAACGKHQCSWDYWTHQLEGIDWDDLKSTLEGKEEDWSERAGAERGTHMSKRYILLHSCYHKTGNQLLCLQAGTTVTSGAIRPRNSDTPVPHPRSQYSSETPILRHQINYWSNCSIRSTMPLDITSGSKLSIRSLASPLSTSSTHTGPLYLTSRQIECDSQRRVSTRSSSNHP